MPLISLIIGLVIVGVVLWAIETLIPLDPMIKRIISVLIVLAVLLWILRAFALV